MSFKIAVVNPAPLLLGNKSGAGLTLFCKKTFGIIGNIVN
jgi:hypothetical protein